MVHSKSKAPQKRTASVVVLTASVVIFAVFLLSQNRGDTLTQNTASVTDPTLEQKARILSLVSSPKPLNEEQKNNLFLSLSGPKMLQYQFTALEKDMIIKALNDANAPKNTAKKNSSAEESFSGVRISASYFDERAAPRPHSDVDMVRESKSNYRPKRGFVSRGLYFQIV